MEDNKPLDWTGFKCNNLSKNFEKSYSYLTKI